ncbi:MAG: hypothetical protein AAFP69_21805, partial [Planctomycetota bacterium]
PAGNIGDAVPEMEDVVGKINPNEPDVIQEFRHAARRTGLAYQTEWSYVSKIRFFMRERGLRNLRGFDRITARDVEAHLTGLAVDGNVVMVVVLVLWAYAHSNVLWLLRSCCDDWARGGVPVLLLR